MDERELRELVRAVVVGTLSGREAEAEKARVEAVRPDPRRAPADLALAKRAAAWMGVAPALPPVLEIGRAHV